MSIIIVRSCEIAAPFHLALKIETGHVAISEDGVHAPAVGYRRGGGQKRMSRASRGALVSGTTISLCRAACPTRCESSRLRVCSYRHR